MYKVIINKPGKRFSFQGKLYTTPCKFFAEDSKLDLVKLLLKKAGINERVEIKSVSESPVRKEANKAAEEAVADAVVKASEEIVAQIEEQQPVVEEQQQQAEEAESSRRRRRK